MAEAITRAAAAIPAPPAKLSYGTAGFRAREEVLDGVFFRCGLLAALRSLLLSSPPHSTGSRRVAIGVMVTASHNPIDDNGVKIVEPDGAMLIPAWEAYACELAHTFDAAALPGVLQSIGERVGLVKGTGSHLFKAQETAPRPVVVIGRDTRPSSDRLRTCVAAGVAALGGEVVDIGVLTTPLLHHYTRYYNLEAQLHEEGHAKGSLATGSAEEVARYAGVEGYYRMLLDGFHEILGEVRGGEERGPLLIDCANGVGGLMARHLGGVFAHLVPFELRNTGDTKEALALLNEGVGAEHAQKARLPPAGFSPTGDQNKRCASIDGDADRLVYHYFDSHGAWHLIDGDKIATLAAVFLADQLQSLGLTVVGTPNHKHHDADGHHAHTAIKDSGRPLTEVSVGVVQTAYANGASTRFIRDTLHLPVPLAKTGVKFVHHAAQEYDIGVYFEANGHGTILFHPEFLTALKSMETGGFTPAQALAHKRLVAASKLINQAVGDALSDSMFIEAVLTLKKWSVLDWDAIYADLPSRQAKLGVPDRNAVKTNEDETRVLSPPLLQSRIDAAVAKYACGRAFVRPSGTEDVVRVYAEADTQAHADALAEEVVGIAKTTLSG